MQKDKKKKVIIGVVIAAVVAAAAVCGFFLLKNKLNNAGAGDGEMGIQLQTVEKQNLSDTVTLSGTISGENVVNYASQATTKFTEVNVKLGDEVKVGDVLAVLDEKDIQRQIEALEKSINNSAAMDANTNKQNAQTLADAKKDQENQLNQVLANINAAKADATAYRTTAARIQIDIDSLNAQIEDKTAQVAAAKAADPNADTSELDKAINELNLQVESKVAERDEANAQADAADAEAASYQSEYDTVKSNTDQAINAAQNTINMQQYQSTDNSSSASELEKLKESLNECKIVATNAGIVTACNAQVDLVNTPGSTLFTVEDAKDKKLVASVEEKDILKLEEGMKVTVTADALGEEEIDATITKVMRVAANDQSNSNEYYGSSSAGFSVEISLPNCKLLSGMKAKAKVYLTDKTDALCIPYDVVRYDDAGETYVLVAIPNGDGTFIAEKRTVELGDEVEYFVEVAGGDIAEGDIVIMSYEVEEGQKFEADYYIPDEAMDGAEGGGDVLEVPAEDAEVIMK